MYPDVYPGVVTAKLQFRVDEARVAYLTERGLNPNEFARQAFEQALRALRAEGRLARLRSLPITFDGRDAARLVREDRDR